MGPENARLSPGGCSGGRTRTPNDWTRTSCVADYTTPDRVPEGYPVQRRVTTSLTPASRRNPTTRPRATATVSRPMYSVALRPTMGLVRVGEADACRPSSDAMLVIRKELNGTETSTTSLMW